MLVNLGTPDAPTPAAIRKYLAEFLTDKRVIGIPSVVWLPILYGFILPFRPAKLVANYQAIWGNEHGPIREHTEALAEKVETEIQKEQFGKDLAVRAAMTYGNPSMAQVLNDFLEAGIEEVVILPLFPQYSTTTTAAVFDKFAKVLKGVKEIPGIRLIKDYHDNPTYVHSISKSIDHTVGHLPDDARLLFSFHGLPQAQADAGDPYPAHCHRTAELVAASLGLEDHQWQITFQSRFGPAPWLQPYTSEVLARLPGEGVKQVYIVCPGFASDCLETLEEIEVENRDIFFEAGGESFTYVPALNSSDDHVALIKELVLGVQYVKDNRD